MLFSQAKLLLFRRKVLCKEIDYIQRILWFFELNYIARTKEEELWREEFITLESLESLEEQCRILEILVNNIDDEIKFATILETIPNFSGIIFRNKIYSF
jgi:hypothetical protein